MRRAPNSIENRKEPRRRTRKGGRIVCGANDAVFDCSIRDLSEGGARLELAHWCSFPKNMVIEIGRNELIEARYEVEVRWASARNVGVQFLRKLPDGESSSRASLSA